eukprot:gene4783-5966_t
MKPKYPPKYQIANNTPRKDLSKETGDFRSSQGVLPKEVGSKISNQWYKRQMTDPYVAKSKEFDLISRAAWKLINIQSQLKLIKKGMKVIDLGASPGSWTQVALDLVGESGQVLSVDLNPLKLESYGDKVNFIQTDATDVLKIRSIINERFKNDIVEDNEQNQQQQQQLTQEQEQEQEPTSNNEIVIEKEVEKENEKVETLITTTKKDDDVFIDGIVSDMAPKYSGIFWNDHSKLMYLAEKAFELAEMTLKRGGFFICKISRGGEEKEFIKKLENRFLAVKTIKPDASRKESNEIYLVCTHFILKNDKVKPTSIPKNNNNEAQKKYRKKNK